MNTLQNEDFAGAILQRGEREALNEVEEALWRTIENSDRMARQEDFRVDDREPQVRKIVISDVGFEGEIFKALNLFLQVCQHTF